MTSDRIALLGAPYRMHSEGMRRDIETRMLRVFFYDHGEVEREDGGSWRVVVAGHFNEAQLFADEQNRAAR